MRLSIRVEGVVQGVGFRPFTHALATGLGLGGFVGNDTDGVFCEVEGDPSALRAFRAALTGRPPPLAVIERVTVSEIPARGERGFTIVPSRAATTRSTLISADTATCADCRRELFDPADRRYRYPFVNCTNCGPRFTIVTDVPYDRPNTTMAGFPMCQPCAAEYHDPTDRRFHAQPTCCPTCGPSVRLASPPVRLVCPPFPSEPYFRSNLSSERPVRAEQGEEIGERGELGEYGERADPIVAAAGLLRSGAILAVKGLGGYHLAVDAASQDAVARLRGRKHREDKPFAVLVPDLAAARALCEVDADAERVLTSPRAPIVLLPRRADARVASAVAPGNASLGLVLPYTPLQHLLAAEFGAPFVLTSGNVSDEPIAYTDDDALTRLSGIADAFLVHNRPIHTRTDDSVIRIFRGREYPIRRSRGYVPTPIALAGPVRRPVLGCGAELKNTFCLAARRHAFVSHHIGDLENYATLRSYLDGIEHFRRLFDIVPEVVAHDLHPEYLSTKYALELDGVELVGVQHHHAHLASCLADNGESGPVIGVALDGLGYGADGTIWGGEFLIASLAAFRRVGHFATVPMPGGTAAIKQPWRMAAAYLDAAFAGSPPAELAVRTRNAPGWDAVVGLARRGLNAPRTSSAGRLFDAVAALVGVRDTVNYEGQAAIELEQCADRSHPGSYPITLSDADVFTLPGADLVRAAAEDLIAGVPVPVIAARFHNAMVDAVLTGCALAGSRSGLDTVALSGGVFQNVLLLERTVAGLERRGFRVLTHSRVPTNDGGISLGQVAVAAAREH